MWGRKTKRIKELEDQLEGWKREALASRSYKDERDYWKREAEMLKACETPEVIRSRTRLAASLDQFNMESRQRVYGGAKNIFRGEKHGTRMSNLSWQDERLLKLKLQDLKERAQEVVAGMRELIPTAPGQYLWNSQWAERLRHWTKRLQGA